MLTEEQRKSIVLTYKLTPSMAKAFELLLDSPMATNDMIQALVNGGDKAPTPAKIVVYRLREQLKGTTITIHKRNRVGYWIDLATKQHILKTLEGNMRHVPSSKDYIWKEQWDKAAAE